MRKLAPLFLTTTIAAFAAGNAFAADPTGSPTVPANTQNSANTSYSDKSPSSPGTNARMDANGTAATTKTPKAKVRASADSTTAMPGDSTSPQYGTAANIDATANVAGADTTTPATDKAKKKAKKKVARNESNGGNANSSTGKSLGAGGDGSAGASGSAGSSGSAGAGGSAGSSGSSGSGG
jgi:pilus assembly protein FimV